MSELSQAERTAMERLQIAAITSAESRGVERGFLAARDHGRERERVLEATLDKIAEAARAAIAASQPEVLSERSDTEPGEPEGQPPSGRITKTDEFPRFLECPGCGMKRLFSPYEGRCDECRSQPDHGPGEPSGGLESESIVENEDGLEDETI